MVRIVAIIATIFMLLSPGISGTLHAHAMTGMDQMAGTMAADQDGSPADADAPDCCHTPVSHCNAMAGTPGQTSGTGFLIRDAGPSIHPDRARQGRIITADPPPPRI